MRSWHKELSVMGKMMILESIILLVPLLVLPFYPKEMIYAKYFVFPAGVSIFLGILAGSLNKRKMRSSQIVVFSWGYGFLLAMIPFLLKGDIPFIHALFESISGFTTTGLSVLDVEALPAIYLFYRAFLQYVGGLGFVMMMLLFVQGKDSAGLYQAEGHSDKLMPTLGKTVKVIFCMYGGFLIVGSICYLLAGMNLLDAIVHGMCALSTGGFSNRMDSIGAYSSVWIQVITIVLMIIGTTNFSILLLLVKGKWKRVMKSSELRFLFGLILIVVCAMTVIFWNAGWKLGDSINAAVFNATSALSTTGFSTSSYTLWPPAAIGIMILLMIIGGGMGSTAGGIKLGRVCRILKNLLKNIRRKRLPDRAVLVTYYCDGNERQCLDQKQLDEATTYSQTYLLIFVVGTLLLTCFSGQGLMECAFEFASSIGTVGLSIGVTNPDANAASLIVEMIGMIFGRLEIFVLFQAFSKS